jgi:hypothetical protein
MYILFVFSSVFIFNGILYGGDFCRYFVKQPYIKVDKDYEVDKFRIDPDREKKKKNLFEFEIKDMFVRYDEDIRIRKRRHFKKIFKKKKK